MLEKLKPDSKASLLRVYIEYILYVYGVYIAHQFL